MNDQLLDSLAHEHIESMLREADAYRQLVDAAPLSFQGPRILRARRAIARGLRDLSLRLDPYVPGLG